MRFGQELRLAYNKIKEIPLGYLSSDLQILDLGHNRICNMSGIMVHYILCVQSYT